MRSMESTELLGRIQSGDRLAEKQLVDEFQVKVFNICNGLLHNVHDAEDITQEVFLEVFRHAKDFRGDSKIGTWIYRIAVNRSLNFLRSNRWNKWLNQVDDFISFSDNGKPEPYTSEQGLELNEQKQILQKAIDALPQNQRVAFTLNKIEELSYNEIAQVMDISHSAVESLIHRAKLKLQKLLKNYFS